MSFHYELIYFSSHGRGEQIRLLLTLAGQPFTERQFERSRWPELKKDMPLGQLPVLVERTAAGERTIPQSQAILRHLARRYGLYGQNDTDMLQADIVADTVVDVGTSMHPMLYGSTKGNPEVIRKYFHETWPVHARRLESLLPHSSSPSGGLFVCASPTFADVAAFQALHTLLALHPHCLDQHPSLQRFYDVVAAVPALVPYLKVRRENEALALRPAA